MAGEYLTNYHKAIDTIKKCSEESEKFAELSEVKFFFYIFRIYYPICSVNVM